MGKPPAFQLYASDFDMDTASWDNEEVGVYFRLLMYQWVNGSIPDDINRLAKITRIGQKRFKKSWRIVSNKFQNNSKNGLINIRMELTRQEQDNYRKLQSEAGKRGVEKKRQKGIYPFKKSSDPLTNPSSDPATRNQAFQSSSLKETIPKGTDGKKAVPLKDIISNGSIPKIKAEIQKVGKELYDNKIFIEVFAFINKMLKENKSERAILHSLTRCYAKAMNKNGFDKDGGPWAYCTKIIQIENGNFNEAEYLKTKT